MQIYHFHPETKEYLSTDSADPNPLEAGKFLIPKYSTTIPFIDKTENTIQVFNDIEWTLKEDYRKQLMYNDDNREGIEITSIGPVDTEYTLLPPPNEYNKLVNGEWIDDINIIKEKLYNEINDKRNEKISQGVQYTFPDGLIGTIQTRDQVDERNVQANASAAQSFIMLNQLDINMEFRDAENQNHLMTPQQMLEMTLYVKDYGQSIYKTSWIMKDFVKNSNDINELIEYTINY
jgi:hypothetical protein